MAIVWSILLLGNWTLFICMHSLHLTVWTEKVNYKGFCPTHICNVYNSIPDSDITYITMPRWMLIQSYFHSRSIRQKRTLSVYFSITIVGEENEWFLHTLMTHVWLCVLPWDCGDMHPQNFNQCAEWYGLQIQTTFAPNIGHMTKPLIRATIINCVCREKVWRWGWKCGGRVWAEIVFTDTAVHILRQTYHWLLSWGPPEHSPP